MHPMRTTINVDDQLLASAKLRAGEQGTTLSGFIENALRETLSVSIRRMEQQPIRLITAIGAGLKPGVDLDNHRSLRDIMDDIS